MILIKKDKKTGKTYKIVVPDYDTPIPIQQPIAPSGNGGDLSISSHSGSLG
jgi:hypothetical protein